MEQLAGLPTNGETEVRARPVLVPPTVAAAPAKKPGRQPVAPEKIAEMKELKKTMTFKEVAEKLNVSVGTVQKYTSTEPPKPRAKRAAKVKAAPKAKRAVKVAVAPKTSNALKAKLYDLLVEGYTAAEIKAAL